MSELRDILKEEYEKQATITVAMLMEMVEAALSGDPPLLQEKEESPSKSRRERVLRLPVQFPTEISVGQKPGSEDRAVFATWMSRIVPGGELKDKIEAIEDFIKEGKTATVSETLSYLMFLNTFAFMIQEFNASVAGFLWEPFLAALFGADSVQVPTSEGDIADVKLLVKSEEGLRRVSLKILRAAGPVGGSFSDLVDHFAKNPDQPMTYVVIKKFEGDTLMKFYEFDVSQETFFTFIGHPKTVFKTELVGETVPYDGEAPIPAREFVQGKIPKGYLQDREVIVKIAGTNDVVARTPGAKIQPGGVYDIYARTEKKLPGAAGPGAKLSPVAKRLWGGDDQYAEFYGMKDQPNFWEIVQQTAPGYLKNEQFEINWSYATEIAENIGNLDISKEALDKAFARGSQTIGSDLTDLFNSLTTLVDNVGRFFMIDCGSPDGPQQKCTEKDADKRSSSGQKAIEDTNTVKRVVDDKIAGAIADDDFEHPFE